MTDEDIKMHLIHVGIKTYPAESLEVLINTIITPMFDFFSTEKDLAKIFLVAQMLEDRAILPVKQNAIEAYRAMNLVELKNKGVH